MYCKKGELEHEKMEPIYKGKCDKIISMFNEERMVEHGYRIL